ncbi:MAG: flavodoxin family protein [Vallitaleaceae bacterium]|nr:flavodoxin family protein [Vallitaleaceae bacterium]
MKIVVIHGSPRKGNTYKATEYFKKEMAKQGEIEFVDYFLPKDMPEFCCGCMNCFLKGELKCPHAKYTMPIMEQMDQADALILTTPVFALSLSGCMKSFLDHFAYAFIVHRPKESMFKKKAFVISSTVGAGTKEAIKTISTSLKFWGVNRIFTYRYGTFGEEWDVMKSEKKEKIEAQLSKKAASFYKDVRLKKRHTPYLYIRMMYLVSKMILKKYTDDTSLDKQYWIEKGWYQGRKSPFSNN